MAPLTHFPRASIVDQQSVPEFPRLTPRRVRFQTTPVDIDLALSLRQSMTAPPPPPPNSPRSPSQERFNPGMNSTPGGIRDVDLISRMQSLTINVDRPGAYAVLLDFNPCPHGGPYAKNPREIRQFQRDAGQQMRQIYEEINRRTDRTGGSSTNRIP